MTKKDIKENFRTSVHGHILEMNKAMYLHITSKTVADANYWNERYKEERNKFSDCIFYLAMAIGEMEKLAPMDDLEYALKQFGFSTDYTGFANIKCE